MFKTRATTAAWVVIAVGGCAGCAARPAPATPVGAAPDSATVLPPRPTPAPAPAVVAAAQSRSPGLWQRVAVLIGPDRPIPLRPGMTHDQAMDALRVGAEIERVSHTWTLHWRDCAVRSPIYPDDVIQIREERRGEEWFPVSWSFSAFCW